MPRRSSPFPFKIHTLILPQHDTRENAVNYNHTWTN